MTRGRKRPRGPYKGERKRLTRDDPPDAESVRGFYDTVCGNSLVIPDADHIDTLTKFVNAVRVLALQAQEEWDAYERQQRLNQGHKTHIRALEAELRPLKTQHRTISRNIPSVQRVARIGDENDWAEATSHGVTTLLPNNTFRPGREPRKPFTPENMAVRGDMRTIEDQIAWVRSWITRAHKPHVHSYTVFKDQLLDLIRAGLQRANPNQEFGKSKEGPAVAVATLIIPHMTGEKPTAKSIGTHRKKPNPRP